MRKVIGVLMMMAMTFGFAAISFNEGWIQQGNVIIIIEHIGVISLGLLIAALFCGSLYLIFGGEEKKKGVDINPDLD